MIGFEKERSFYPLILIFIAVIYLLFATIDSRAGVIGVEAAVMIIFIFLAVSGFKKNCWWIVSGFAAHGIRDYFLNAAVYNTGILSWRPEFCLGYAVFIA